jgi:hypothetical protein
MTKRASGEKLPTVNNIHKLRGRLTTLEGADGAGGSLTSDGPGLEISDKKIKLKDLGVVESKLAANSVTAAKIKDSNITTSHFNTNILGNGIIIDSSKLTLKLNTESGLTLNGSGLSVDTLFLPTLSPWYEMALKTGWSAYASDYGYKVEYRFIEYGTERRYFLRGHVKKSSGPTDWDIICDVAGAPNVMLPPQNQHFIVSVNDNDKNPFNFNQWTLQIRGSHNGIASTSGFILFGKHDDADRSEEIHEANNTFSLDGISWWVDKEYYPTTSAATTGYRPASRLG